MSKLVGDVCMVTGAGSGIGRAIARRLASDNAKVAVTDINLEDATETTNLIKKDGNFAFASMLDVTKNDSIKETVDRIVADLGPINILVNNAGVSTMNWALELTEKEWDYNFDVNTKGVFLVSQYVGRQMVKEGKGGRIITIASIDAKRGAPLLAHYAASKWAVVGFCRTLALELAPHNINVNCVCPGYVRTSMQKREIEWEARLKDSTIEEISKSYIKDVPLGRLQEPEDVASVVSFLASKDSSYITAQAINVSGGFINH